MLGIEFYTWFSKKKEKKKKEKRKMKNVLNANEVKLLLPFKIQTKIYDKPQSRRKDLFRSLEVVVVEIELNEL